MARPPKEGLTYFSTVIDEFEDEKFFDLQNEYGPLGEAIYNRLLKLIYKNGYYYKVESFEKLAATITKSIGSRWVRDKNRVIQVISLLSESGILDKTLMHDGILTSVEIQRQYLQVAARRVNAKNKKKDYWLLNSKEEKELLEDIAEADSLKNALKNIVSVDNNGVSANNNPDNVGNNPTKKSKAKQNEKNKNKADLNEIKKEGSKEVHSAAVHTADNSSDIIAKVAYRSNGGIKHLIFTQADADMVRADYPDIDLKTEAFYMQVHFDKPEMRNVNKSEQQWCEFFHRWFKRVQNGGGSRQIEDETFDIGKFFEAAAKKRMLREVET